MCVHLFSERTVLIFIYASDLQDASNSNWKAGSPCTSTGEIIFIPEGETNRATLSRKFEVISAKKELKFRDYTFFVNYSKRCSCRKMKSYST